MARVQGAAAATRGAGALGFDQSTVSASGATTVTIDVKGSADAAARLAQASVSLTRGPGQSLTVDERFLADDLYLSVPAQPGTFYRLKPSDLAGTTFGTGTDVTAQLSVLGSTGPVTQVGTEQVRGAATVHYRGTYDLGAAAAAADPSVRQQLDAARTAGAAASVPYDVFLDAQGRVRRFTQVLSTTPASGPAASATTTLETFDFGKPVAVPSPPAGSVKDGAPLVAALKGAQGGQAQG